MINLFLKAKHWQLFLCAWGIPFILQMVLLYTFFNNIAQGSVLGPSSMGNLMLTFLVTTFLSSFTVFGWLWSMVMGLQHKIPAGITMKTTRFKVFFFIPVAYFIIIFTGIGYLFTRIFGASPGWPPINPVLIAIVIPCFVLLHLFSIFCIFHSIYFAAKTVKTAELQRAVTFNDFAGEFFLIWFNIIGFWIVQPMVNKLAGQTSV